MFILFHRKGLFHLQQCLGHTCGYVWIIDLALWVLCCVLLPSSFISISKDVIFHLQSSFISVSKNVISPPKMKTPASTNWRKNNMMYCKPEKRWYILIIAGRGVQPPLPLFYEDPAPPCIAYPCFFQILSTPSLPCCLQPHPPLLILLSCFFGWMGDHTTFDVLFYLMISWNNGCTHVEP